MKTLLKPVAAVCLLTLGLTSCMQQKEGSPGASTSDPAYNNDTRTPEPQDRKGDYEQTHKPNTGPDNDSDSMQ